ncbi:MAG: bifunctional folylpolyglutamate synthase/dihydrofolate synthase [Fusicatenibacter sp.]|nr:bifunctional folylpolyglutamate synthase/dihydrofolate synthase [Fusicatenibacter sp.]
MNYTEAVDYIESIPKFTTKNPPEHTRELLRRLGDPQKGMKVIHVAGTNGKGSVCSYLNSMLIAGGYCTGLFTSPHLVKINERYQINSQVIDDDAFLRAFEKVEKVAEEYCAEGHGHPSYFETLFLMGMILFLEAGVEYLILETGLGGRLDATNVIEQPLACIITSISRDHTEYLGDTIEEIAGEKAGIIKKGVPVIYDAHDPRTAAVIEKRAANLGSPAYPLVPGRYRINSHTKEGIGFEFLAEEGQTVKLFVPYVAEYQMMNASLAYLTMDTLKEIHKIPEETLIEGIKSSSWPCRMETVMPGVVIDGAHNEDGVAQFVRTAAYFAGENEITILFSAVSDKRYRDMIREISEGIHPDHVVATQITGSRQVPCNELAEDFRLEGCRDVHADADVGKAFETALALKGSGMLFCVGSLYLAGEIKDHISKRNQ